MHRVLAGVQVLINYHTHIKKHTHIRKGLDIGCITLALLHYIVELINAIFPFKSLCIVPTTNMHRHTNTDAINDNIKLCVPLFMLLVPMVKPERVCVH